MKIIIDPHTLQRAAERGALENEIIDTIINGNEEPAKGNRFSKSKIFLFGKSRNEKYYEHKKIQVIFVIEKETIITVTVYVFFGKWI